MSEINWKAFRANGGFSNENRDPLFYLEGDDDDSPEENSSIKEDELEDEDNN